MNIDTIESLRAERDALLARVDRVTWCAKESQGWDWLKAQEEGFEKAMDHYGIPEMQELHEVAHDETSAQSLNHIKAAAITEAIGRATQGFSLTVVRVDELRAIADEWRGE